MTIHKDKRRVRMYWSYLPEYKLSHATRDAEKGMAFHSLEKEAT